MQLLAFRVREFRSVDDSGWVDVDQVTGLIGTNESGKTNVLIPLWKLKPARGGAIDPMADYPRKRYHEIRVLEKKPIFIQARFGVSSNLCRQITELLDVSDDRVKEIIVSRDFDGKYHFSLPPDAEATTQNETEELASILTYDTDNKAQAVPRQEVLSAIEAARSDIENDPEDDPLRQSINDALGAAHDVVVNCGETVAAKELTEIREAATVDVSSESPHSVSAARLHKLQKHLEKRLDEAKSHDLARLIFGTMPSFVYYSNYGNLDSEIYLPHVSENLNRTDLGQKEQAQVRTLKVLFDFVKLSPEEIAEMGKDVEPAPGTDVTPDRQKDIDRIANVKRERDILLQSASTELTDRFREWWKQGQYRFRFAADGNHFRIWVSDDKRPEDIELESRSTGLQWFFSFYLVFLVESQGAHEDAILLLDEPGLTLHPLAQGDLSEFFDGLGKTNQLIYTAQSPFMVDADHLDRARAVYTDEAGITRVSSDLRAPSDDSYRSKSVYAAYAALRMSVSETLLLGCQPVVVEGPSDQHYASAIKAISLVAETFVRLVKQCFAGWWSQGS